MREILFRGQTRKFGQKVNMAGEKQPGIWVYGGIFTGTGDFSVIYGGSAEKLTGADIEKHVVYSDTVGQFTGVYDTELTKIFEGDIVRFLGYVGTVVFQDGCFGIAFDIRNSFDWDYIDEEMKEYAGTNQITACFNDHFISLWEILWNFNCDQPTCDVVEVIGNIHDNPDLLEG